jgi:CubicO group peptidase (beta-lactamase class C family)
MRYTFFMDKQIYADSKTVRPPIVENLIYLNPQKMISQFFIGLRASFPAIFLILLLAASAGTLYPEKSTAPITEKQLKKIDFQPIISYFRGHIPVLMEENKVPGFAVAVVTKDGIPWIESFGVTAYNSQNPVTDNTLFSVQSMSKTFTATGILLAVQDGLLDLDTPITNYLPDFTVNSRFEENPQENITLRLLLEHKAGFTHEAPSGNNFNHHTASFAEHIKSISNTWLRFPVGQRFSYSNLGIDLAGYILQVVSGMPFEEYMQVKLLVPLGMKNSSFDMNSIKYAPDRAVGHDIFHKQLPLEIPMVPSGGLYTSARELTNYIRFHLNGGKVDGQVLLEKSFLDEMYRLPPPTSLNTSDGYALGIVKLFRNDSVCFTHSGSGFGFSSTMAWYRDYEIGLLALSNMTCDQFIEELSNRILDKIIQQRLPRRFLSNDEQIKRYIGRYKIRQHGLPLLLVEIRRSGSTLFLNDSNLGRLPLREHLPGLFFAPNGEALDMRSPVPTWRNIPMEQFSVSKFEHSLLGLLLAVFVSAFAGWPVSKILYCLSHRRASRRYCDENNNKDKGLSSAFYITGFHALLTFSYLVGLKQHAPFLIYSGMPLNPLSPLWLKLALYFPLVILFFTLVSLIFSFVSWKKSYWSMWSRLHYSIVTLASILSVLVLFRWKLLFSVFQ